MLQVFVDYAYHINIFAKAFHSGYQATHTAYNQPYFNTGIAGLV